MLTEHRTHTHAHTHIHNTHTHAYALTRTHTTHTHIHTFYATVKAGSLKCWDIHVDYFLLSYHSMHFTIKYRSGWAKTLN